MSKLQFEDITEPQPKELPEALKLRVWNKARKEYFYVEYNKDYHQIVLTNKAKSIFYPLTSLLFTAQWETPERPTSLPDKNEKIIYEGDFCKVNTGGRYTSGYGVVEYFQPGCKFVVNGFLDNPSGFYERRKGEFFRLLEEWLCTEIIGNIHTTPELLEVQE